MNPQAHTVRNTRHDPRTDETALQERSCDPERDSSLPAEDVITHMRDLDESSPATLFVP
jgi:hypothetical protein